MHGYNNEEMHLLQQGAEAKVYRTLFLGKPAIIKERFVKKYRLPEIDKMLTQKRLTQEVRALVRCRKIGLLCPAIYFIDNEQSILIIEDIEESITVKEYIYNKQSTILTLDKYHEDIFKIVQSIGIILAAMHNADIIHGDLTTSNMLITNEKEKTKIHMIDFGLSSSSSMSEDKGVDLYVLERSFYSTHPNSEKLFEELLSSYFKKVKNSQSISEKLEEIRLRGRKRSMLG